MRVGFVMLATALLLVACGTTPPTARPSGSGGVAGASAAAGAGQSAGPTAQAVKRCKAADLKAQITGWSPASNSQHAEVTVSNRSGVTCTVRGTPGARLLDAKGRIVLDSAKIKTVGGPKVRTDDPVVVIGPGDEISLDVQWTNWCKVQPTRPLTVAFVLTDKGGLLKAAKAKKTGDDDAPVCSAKKNGSEVRVTHAWIGPGL